ncbi:MAG: hypothetical protein NTU47_01405 [Ignavibacteriales bacterium]|nr:hypothetical protein [Ignavibacteriales bacterium]
MTCGFSEAYSMMPDGPAGELLASWGLVKHISEHSIELYVLKPTIFDAATRAFMEEHLRSCAVCAEVERELRVYHAELNSNPRTASDRVRVIIERPSELSSVIRLYPYKHLPGSGFIDNRGITVLAAQSPGSFPHRFKPVAVYSSVDQQIVVRIVQDTEEDLYKLYVLGAQQENCRFAVVSFPELEMDLGTDESGKKDFSLPADKRPSDWYMLNAFVRLRGQ